MQDPNIGATAPAAAAHTSGNDPVCGRAVDRTSPALTTEYAGITYAFCSQPCLDRFVEQPDIFTGQPGRGNVAERDRALRTDDDRGELEPGQPARLSNSPPTPGAG